MMDREISPLFDINVAVGRWPFQPLEPATVSRLARHLERQGIAWAAVSSLDAVLYQDPQWGNLPLLKALENQKSLLPACVINPSMAHWKESLRVCHGKGCRMVKLYPNYHQYSLGSPEVDALVSECDERDIRLAIAFRLEDERAHYPLMKVPATSLDEIVQVARRHPRIPFVLLCPYHSEVPRLSQETQNTLIEISHIESLDTLSSLLNLIPASRVLFGSHTPFLYTGAATAKLKDAPLPAIDFRRIGHQNALRLFRHGLSGTFFLQPPASSL